eukprot:403362875
MFGRGDKDTAFTQAPLLTDDLRTFSRGLSKKKVFGVCFVASLALFGLYSTAQGNQNDTDLNVESPLTSSAIFLSTPFNESEANPLTFTDSDNTALIPYDIQYLIDSEGDATLLSLQFGDAMQVSDKIGSVANNIASLSGTLKDIADASEKFKKVVNVIGIIGNSISILGALAGLISLFVPDPVMLKLNSISDQIYSLQNSMDQQFKQVEQLVVGSICWSQMDLALSAVQSTQYSASAYIASQNRDTDRTKDQFLDSYRNNQVEKHLNFLLDSLNGKLNDCNILEILKEGGRSTQYYRGSSNEVGAKGSLLLLQASNAIGMTSIYQSILFGGTAAQRVINSNFSPRFNEAQSKLIWAIDWCDQSITYTLNQNIQTVYNKLKGELNAVNLVTQIQTMVKAVYKGKEYYIQAYKDWEDGAHHSFWINGYGTTYLRTRDLSQNSKKYVVFASVGTNVGNTPKANEYLNDLKYTSEYLFSNLNRKPDYFTFMKQIPYSYTLDKGIRDVAFWKRQDDEHFVSSTSGFFVYKNGGQWLGTSFFGGRMIYFNNDKFRYIIIGWK